MKDLLLLAIGSLGAVMYDSSESRAQHLGAVLVSGAVFGLISSVGEAAAIPVAPQSNHERSG